MQFEQSNIYEQAFACWLRENHIPFVPVDQTKRIAGPSRDIKNFDMLVRPDTDVPLLVEVKGRTFHGNSLAGLKGLDGWATWEDVQALTQWLQAFQNRDSAAKAVFVFVFRLIQIDIETDGQAVYDFGDERFVMLAIRLQDYQTGIRQRSPKWQTVTLPAADFRRYAVPVEKIFLPPQ